MTKIRILLLATLVSLISCSKDDAPGDQPTEENPRAENCKITSVDYGFFSGDRVYTATHNGKNLTELTSNVDKVVFTYDAQNHLTRKEFFTLGNSQVQLKTEFTTNSNGQITEQRNWEFYSGSLKYTGKETYTYTGNKLTQVTSYDLDDTSIEGRHIVEWTGDNPTKWSVYNEANVLECENTIAYDLTEENSFNATFPYFAFQDIYDEDFQLYLFSGKNIITSITNSCSGDADSYSISLLPNKLIQNVKMNGDLLWEFQYDCE